MARLRTPSKRLERPATVRAFSLILAIVAACFAVLLVFNAFRDNKPVAWQMLIISALAESAFDTIANYYSREEDAQTMPAASPRNVSKRGMQ